MAPEYAMGLWHQAFVVAVSVDRVDPLAGVECDALAGGAARLSPARRLHEETAGVAGGRAVSAVGVDRLRSDGVDRLDPVRLRGREMLQQPVLPHQARLAGCGRPQRAGVS